MLEPSTTMIRASVPWAQAIKVTRHEGRATPVIQAVRVWPRPRSMFHGLVQGRWTPGPVCTSGGVLAAPHVPHIDGREFEGFDTAVHALLLQIPQEVRQALAAFPRVFAWKVLVLVGHVPEALDLVRRHPVLAGLVAFGAPDGNDLDTPYHQVRQHLGGAPESLLGFLGLPEDPRLVAFLDAMQPEVLRELGDDSVMELLQEQSRRWL